MYDRKATVLVLVVIMTALALFTGCASTSLRWSVRTGNVSKVEKLIDEGADVDERYRWSGKTALNMAVRRGNLQIVTLLIKAGANIEAMDGECQTPLMTAAAAGDVEMASFLIKCGADINMSNNCQGIELAYPATALMAASVYWHAEVAELLIDAGADVHHRDARGDTALEWAIDWGWGEDYRKMLETVVVLVQAGADGPRALWLVRRDRDAMDELAKLLHEAGAPNSLRLAYEGDYSRIAEYLEKWRNVRDE